MITGTDKEKLASLIEAFHNLTGIKVAVFDNELKKIFSFPKTDSPLCLLIQNNKESGGLCDESTCKLCERCRELSATLTFKCHAGLTEVVTPLTDGISIIGYIMFGQISTEPDSGIFINHVLSNCKKYGIDEEKLIAEAEKVPYYSEKRIEDASKILHALSGYIVYENIVYPVNSNLGQRIIDYIKDNLSGNLSIEHLCREFFVSRTELYKIISPYTNGKVAAFIKSKRIQAAAELMKKTDKPSYLIAEEVGFSDVNYFLRCFKKEMGISAADYRKKALSR